MIQIDSYEVIIKFSCIFAAEGKVDKSKDAKKRKSGPATPADVKGAKKKPPGDPKQPQGFDRGLEPERIIGEQKSFKPHRDLF